MRKIVYLFSLLVSVPLYSDLGPIRFAGDANAIVMPEAVITISGNYRLARIINPAVNGITIAVDDVSLDLNNFTIDGGGVAVGINAASTRKNITIKNGYIKNCSSGITIGSSATNISENITIENVTTLTNTEGLVITNAQNVQCTNCKNSFNSNGVRFDRIRNSIISDCEFNSNTAIGFLMQATTAGQTRGVVIQDCQSNNNATVGFRIDGGQNLTLINCRASINGQGFTLDSSRQVQYINCITSQNVAVGKCDGFLSNVSTDVFYDHCISMSNLSTSITSGFNTTGGIKTIYESCIATDNTGTSSGIGFNLSAETNSCVLNCLSKRNNGTTVTGIGIRSANGVDCIIQNNFVLENTGASSIGIEVSGGGSLSTAVLGNRAQDHGINNYVISPGTILSVVYTRNSNPPFVSGTATPLTNIDIQ